MIAQDDADNGLRRVVGIDHFEQIDELLAAVQVFNVGEHMAEVQVDTRQDGDRAMTDILIISADIWRFARNRR